VSRVEEIPYLCRRRPSSKSCLPEEIVMQEHLEEEMESLARAESDRRRVRIHNLACVAIICLFFAPFHLVGVRVV
jgi:hypothetical protein